MIVGDIKGEEVGEINELPGQASGKSVETQVHIFKIGEICEGSRNWACQVVVRKNPAAFTTHG